MSESWNLGDGLENVCNSVMRKLQYVGYQLEERNKTIINVDSYEVTALIWALYEYMHDGRLQNETRSSRDKYQGTDPELDRQRL